ncbi:hypothetical protein HGA92_02705 [Candidatus Gracilibacteria bacterium]|nr:hypothetical protein [Candidatus Gracilibacteria bacterium]NUJ98327.1 hypothetical protein [Candidatus Gracilibacteria bacterium]NUJ99318.1 hypothetical protein [Candidatus Gracilibacteria bacterium]
MKKNIIGILLILSLLLVSCGKKEVENTDVKVSDTTTKTVSEEKTVLEETTEEKMNATMMEIYKKGKPATCTFKITGEDGAVYDSIMYIDGKVLKYVMKGEIEGQKLENNVLIKDGFSYTWSNMDKQGFKMKENLNEETSEEGNEMEAQEMNETYEFSCKKGANSSMFELPSDIKFQEFDMPNMPEIPNGTMGE